MLQLKKYKQKEAQFIYKGENKQEMQMNDRKKDGDRRKVIFENKQK